MQDGSISQVRVAKSLLRADTVVQLRQSRSIIMSTLFALIILITWHSFVSKSGLADWKHILLATCLSIVLAGMGMLGYPALVARDRDSGVFQRLRVTPASSTSIMLSRLLVQVAVIGMLSIVVMAVAAAADSIVLTPAGYLLTLCMSVLGGALYLSVGQLLVALIASQNTLNSVGRVIYFPVVILGGLADLRIFGDTAAGIVSWTPYGTVQAVLEAAMRPSQWNMHDWLSFGITIAYTVLFAAIGIRYFRWVSTP